MRIEISDFVMRTFVLSSACSVIITKGYGIQMEDTIAAIATAPGEGGIGIVRISGEKSRDILEHIFTRVKKEYSKQRAVFDDADDASDDRGKSHFLPDVMNQTIGLPLTPRMMHYGFVYDHSGDLIDEVMAVWFKAPYSYTAEDVVEIQCHGSIVSLRKILSLVLKKGARLAEPGEFTKRAFLNGRIDLSQAEAVIDLIRAKSDKSFDTALAQLEGNFSKVIRDLRGLLVDVLVDVTVNIDYPDEDIEQITFENLTLALKEIRSKLAALLATSATGRMLREGMQVTIIGKPNVGKSSLMNALLRETRAIVTEIPGTTRDTIEEGVSVRGIPIRLTDTAGIRQTEDVIEKIGIEKSKESFNRADLVIFMIDRSQPLDEEDYEIIRHLDGKKSIVVLNKSDLPSVVDQKSIQTLLPEAILLEAAVGRHSGITELEDVVGTRSFRAQLATAGFLLTETPDDDTEILILGFDRELTYRKLEDACKLLVRGRRDLRMSGDAKAASKLPAVDYYATNPDWVCPTAFGSVPDCGSMAWMLEKATGRLPKFIGKPEPDMALLALEKTGFCVSETLLIGDRLYTDIACGNRAGVDTAFVLSGEGTLADLAMGQGKPTYIFENIAEVCKAVFG